MHACAVGAACAAKKGFSAVVAVAAGGGGGPESKRNGFAMIGMRNNRASIRCSLDLLEARLWGQSRRLRYFLLLRVVVVVVVVAAAAAFLAFLLRLRSPVP